MEYLLVILIGIAVIWAAYFFSNRAGKTSRTKKSEKSEKSDKSEKSEKPEEPEEHPKENKSGLKGDLADGTAFSHPVNHGVKASKQSLDALYAEAHGLWVCRHCETMNDNYAPNCVACGYKNSRK